MNRLRVWTLSLGLWDFSFFLVGYILKILKITGRAVSH